MSPEEDREIQKRLKRSSLTLPDSEEATEIRTLAEIVASPPAPTEWLVEGVIRRGGALMVYGPAGVGKSWFVHTLMMLAAAGQRVAVKNKMTGHPLMVAGPQKGARVALIDGEMTEDDIRERAITLCEGLELTPVGTVGDFTEPLDLENLLTTMREQGEEQATIDLVARRLEPSTAQPMPQEEHQRAEGTVDLGNILVAAKTLQPLRAKFVDMSQEEWKHQLIHFAKGQQIDLLILDNLTTLNTEMEDENDATSWYPMNNLVVALKREGIAVIVVHHANKVGTSYRGSTAIEATLERVIRLARPDSAPPQATGACFKVMGEKSRLAFTPPVIGKTLRLTGGTWEVDADPLQLAETVVEYAKSLRYGKQEELGEALGVHQSQVSRAFQAAEAMGLAKVSELNACLGKARKLRKDMLKPFPDVDMQEEDDEEDVDLGI